MNAHRKPASMLPYLLAAAAVVVPLLAALTMYVDDEVAPLEAYVSYAKGWEQQIVSPGPLLAGHDLPLEPEPAP